MKKNILRPFRKNRKKFYIYFYTNYKIDKISLYNYDIHNPQTISGPLQEYLHTILHNKGTANIVFSFPFKNIVKVQIIYNISINISQLIHIIQTIYKHIYDIEEISASPIQYNYFKKCNNCKNTIEYTSKYNYKENDTCTICLSNLSQEHKSVILNCGHYFHKNCLLQWFIYGNGKTCPICRQHISNCLKCNGTQQIQQSGYEVVIPKQHREDQNIRNHTNGLFEIYDYDLERLILDNIYIDNKDSNINIYVSV